MNLNQNIRAFSPALFAVFVLLLMGYGIGQSQIRLHLISQNHDIHSTILNNTSLTASTSTAHDHAHTHEHHHDAHHSDHETEAPNHHQDNDHQPHDVADHLADYFHGLHEDSTVVSSWSRLEFREPIIKEPTFITRKQILARRVRGPPHTIS